MNNNFNNQSQQVVIDKYGGDLTGDGLMNFVSLVGNRPYGPNYPYYENLHLVIEDKGRKQVVSLPMNKGFAPNIILSNISNVQIPYILVALYLGTTKSSVVSFIYSMQEDKANLVFNSDYFRNAFKYLVEYQDNYKVKIKNLNLNREYTVDISSRPQEYLRRIYDANGKLIRPVQGYVGNIDGAGSIATGVDGNNKLILSQPIYGEYSTDIIGRLITILIFEGNKYSLYSQYV